MTKRAGRQTTAKRMDPVRRKALKKDGIEHARWQSARELLGAIEGFQARFDTLRMQLDALEHRARLHINDLLTGDDPTANGGAR